MINSVNSPSFGRLMAHPDSPTNQRSDYLMGVLFEKAHGCAEDAAGFRKSLFQLDNKGIDVYMKSVPDEDTIEFSLRKAVDDDYYVRENDYEYVLGQDYYIINEEENFKNHEDNEPPPYLLNGEKGATVKWNYTWDDSLKGYNEETDEYENKNYDNIYNWFTVAARLVK